MRQTLLLAIGLFIFTLLFAFRQQDKVGKALFNQSCSSCHSPNKATEFAPSFQNIRKDYGLKWTVAFLHDSYKMIRKKDTRTLYSYYLFDKRQHISFPMLEEKYIVKILDYVDSYPTDQTQYRHRQVSEAEKIKYVNAQLLKDTVRRTTTVDTSYYEADTIQNMPFGRRRAKPEGLRAN